MTLSCGTDTHLLRKSPRPLAVDMPRMACFFRSKYPTGTAAAVAADLGTSTRTAEGWLGSNPSTPRATHLVMGILTYGPEFLAILLPEPLDWVSEAARNAQRAKVLQEIADLERQLEE